MEGGQEDRPPVEPAFRQGPPQCPDSWCDVGTLWHLHCVRRHGSTSHWVNQRPSEAFLTGMGQAQFVLSQERQIL